MKRCISLLLIAALALSLTCLPAAADDGERQEVTLQYLTGPVFTQHHNGGWVPLCICGDYVLFSATGGSVIVLDMFGRIVDNREIDQFGCVAPGLYYLRLRGAEYGALCHGATAFTPPIYKNVKVMGDCIVAETASGLAFFDLQGSVRPVCPLPAGYSPMFVTSAGSVVARHVDDSVWSSIGEVFYRYQLFDRNGKPLLPQEYQNLHYVDGSTTLLAGLSTPSEAVFDVNGKYFFDQSMNHRLSGDQLLRQLALKDINSPYGEPLARLHRYEVYDMGARLLYTFDALWAEDVSDSLRLVQAEDFRYGLMDRNGNWVVEPVWDEYSTNGEALFDMAFEPDTQLVCLKKGSEFAVYNGDGRLVLSGTDAEYVALFEDAVRVTAPGGSARVYDAAGQFLFATQPDSYFESCCGVYFVHSGEGYRVVDRTGTPLSDEVYQRIDSTRVYGLANVLQNGRVYVVNARGRELNEAPFDRWLDFEPWDVEDFGAREALAVYEQNGRVGVCRYLPPERGEFADVGEKDWFREAVEFCTENGVFTGTGTGRFSPASPMTRAMTVTVLYRIAGSPAVTAPTDFADVPAGAYYADAVSWAQAEGIVNGTTPSTFSPNDNITRQQMAAILCRYTDPEAAEAPEAVLQVFPDWEESASYARAPLAWAVEQGLINGTAAGDRVLLNPLGNATRAQVAAILMRFLRLTAEETPAE